MKLQAHFISDSFEPPCSTSLPRPQKWRPWVAFTVAAIVASGIVSCATTKGHEVATRTSTVARHAASEVVQVRDSVNRAVAALDELTQRWETNPQETLETFTTGVSSAETGWKKAMENQRELTSMADDYFRDWAQRIAVIESESMRNAANDRRREMMDAISDLRDQFAETRSEFEPYLAQLSGLRTMLQNDFTSQGLEAAKSFIERARGDADDARTALEELVDASEDVNAAFAAVGAAPRRS